MGDLSHDAYRFVEFLQAAGQSIWQVLPLGPTHVDGCPYQCLSTHAGNPMLISFDWMADRGWLPSQVMEGCEGSREWRQRMLEKGCRHALTSMDSVLRAQFEQFCRAQAFWLEDYTRFIVLKALHNNAPWTAWPDALRRYQPAAIEQALQAHSETLLLRKFEQFVFFRQWQELRAYAHQRGVYLFGDLPIFVSGDSADVWANRQFFSVDEQGAASVVAGVPPDAFTEQGQRWGNPLYDWASLKKDNFGWWLDRLRTQFALFDIVRIDHFRGLESYWEIPESSATAIDGRWMKAPGAAMLQAIKREFGDLPLVAEDLGIITSAVDDLRRQFSLPGMKVLQFAFDGDPHNAHLPHNHSIDMVAYTGTHDNDTSLSWYQTASPDEQHRLRRYLQCADNDDMPWPMIRSAMMSVANTAIVPMQDIIGLGSGNRMNLPGTTTGNWSWRFDWHQLADGCTERLRELTETYSRHSTGPIADAELGDASNSVASLSLLNHRAASG